MKVALQFVKQKTGLCYWVPAKDNPSFVINQNIFKLLTLIEFYRTSDCNLHLQINLTIAKHAITQKRRRAVTVIIL